MQQFDKFFAGLCLLCMMVFWFALTPAAITSRVSEAKPVSLTETGPAGAPSGERAALTYKQKRQQNEQRLSAEATARLKERKRDTPPEARKRMIDIVSQPVEFREGERPEPRSFDDIPEFPTVH